MSQRSKSQPIVHPRRARRVGIALAIAFALAALPVVVLYLAGVPLGQEGKFVYRYSDFVIPRLASAVPVVFPASVAAVAIGLLCQGRRWLGYATAVVGIIWLVGWSFAAPPHFMLQHAMNFHSPSHDGAFLNEAELIQPGGTSRSQGEMLGGYLRQFDKRIQTPWERFGGTRVISNPPLTTVLFRWITWTWPGRSYPPGWIERVYLESYPTITPDLVASPARSLRVALVCSIGLALAGVAAVGLGREFLSPPAAVLFAVIVTFNPMTVHFNPGKDPAQLLTVNLMLWAWFAGDRRRWWVLHAVAGMVLAIGMGFGLIHLWVAIAALAGTAWHALASSGGGLRFLGRHVLPTVAGGVLLWLAVWMSTGWNLAATVLAVAQRWSVLQPELGYHRGLWLAIGLPNVLVFVAAGVWLAAIAALRWRWRPGSFGGRLAVATLLTMVVVYFTGIPYELPRLWVVFLPPLTLGLMATQPLSRGRTNRRVMGLMLLVLMVQVTTTVIHWTLLDARESEYRLKTQRLFN
jgi:hypothetical protein